MRSLFLKIFLTFWATVLLMGLVMVVTWNMQSDVVISRWQASTADAVRLYAQGSAEEMDRYGRESLENYFQRLESVTRMRPVLYDEGGKAIAGWDTENARALAADVGSGTEPKFDVSGGTAYAAKMAQGPSGRRYIFVAQMPRGPLGAFKPATATTLARWLLAVLISGLICYLLTRYLTRPILRLRAAAMDISAGNLAARAAPQMEKRRDEIGTLVRDFNHMAERIESLVTSQRQLISDISHELRSPLARLNVALGLLQQKAPAGSETQLDRIEREAERLNELIGRLLSLARIEAASNLPGQGEVDLRQLVSEVAADAAFEAQEKNCKVATSVEDCKVYGEVDLLRSAIENVVRNAIRYTRQGSDVDISLHCRANAKSGRYAEVMVRDFGPGVPREELENIFRPFYRVANARERDTGGTGLGLAITRRVVQLHRGEVRATLPDGGGLAVHILLPCDGAPGCASAKGSS